MTKDTKRKSNGNGDALAGNGNGVVNGVDFAPFIKAGEAMFNGMMTLGQEVSDFATSRLRENMEFTSTVLKCGDPQEAVRLEMDYARHATQRYLDEASKLMKIAADVSQKGWAPLEEATRDSLKRFEPH